MGLSQWTVMMVYSNHKIYKNMYKLIYIQLKVILHTCWLSPNLEPLVVLAVAVRDDVHQLEVGHVALDQAVDDPL